MGYLFLNLNNLQTLTLVLIVETLRNVGVRLCSEIFLWGYNFAFCDFKARLLATLCLICVGEIHLLP